MTDPFVQWILKCIILCDDELPSRHNTLEEIHSSRWIFSYQSEKLEKRLDKNLPRNSVDDVHLRAITADCLGVPAFWNISIFHDA